MRWRTRMRYVALPGGARGLHVHRSDEVVEIDDCLIDASAPAEEPAPASVSSPHRETVVTSAGRHDFQVDSDGFWQSHVEAPRVLVETVLDLLGARAGERVLDLYAGVGLFARFLADVVGAEQVTLVEGDRRACDHAGVNVPGATQTPAGARIMPPINPAPERERERKGRGEPEAG